MSFTFWGLAIAMLITATAFVVVPLKTGKSLFASPPVLLLAVLPLCAVAVYTWLGSPGAFDTQHADVAGNQRPAANKPLASVASMVEGLAARLEREPDDAEGWILLARSYQHLGNSDAALTAYNRASELGKSDMDLEAALLGANLSANLNTQSAGPAIRGRVALAPGAIEQVQPGDTLFVFAKESREHRMPVLALRRKASELPLEFALTDKEIMLPGSKLSDFSSLVVTAKISRSGNANDDSLGLEAWSESVSPASSERIDLIIGAASE